MYTASVNVNGAIPLPMDMLVTACTYNNEKSQKSINLMFSLLKTNSFTA